MVFAAAKLTEVVGNVTYEDGEYFNTNDDATEVPTDIPEEAITVALMWNNIKDITPGAFSYLSNCKHLGIYGNELKMLRADMWMGLDSFKYVKFG